MRYVLGVLALLACNGFNGHRLTYRTVPDTRSIISITLDATIVNKVVELFEEALPNERALCLYGIVTDSTNGTYIKTTAVTPALDSAADKYNVWFYSDLGQQVYGGCIKSKTLIGLLHDHPYTSPMAQCTHSDSDALLLSGDRRTLFSMIFCQDGRGEILWQDGRRWAFTPRH